MLAGGTGVCIKMHFVTEFLGLLERNKLVGAKAREVGCPGFIRRLKPTVIDRRCLKYASESAICYILRWCISAGLSQIFVYLCTVSP